MNYTCNLCQSPINSYTQRWYSLIQPDGSLVKCACKKCKDINTHSLALEMTDDLTPHQVFAEIYGGAK